jgi:hypothetical protein
MPPQIKRPLAGYDLPDFPPAPPSRLPAPLPQLPFPPQPTTGLSDMEQAITPAPLHFTLPAEKAGMAASQAAANTPSALAGLRAAQQPASYQPAPTGQRNPIAVGLMLNKLGLPSSFGDGSISQQDISSVYTPEDIEHKQLEFMKAGSPVAAERERTRGQLAVEQARQAGQQQLEQAGYEQFQELLNSGKVEPGSTITGPKFSFRTATPSQMVPAGFAKGAGDELKRLREIRANLPLPGSFLGGLYKAQGEFSGKSLEEVRAIYDKRIADLESELHLPSTATSPAATGGAAPIRKPIPDGSGIAESTDGGKTWHRVQ